MTPQIREKTAKTAVFRHRWQAWRVVRAIAAVRQRPRTPRNRRCSFAFFETFLWHVNKKQRAEVIFRLSRPVSCKNQENGSGKRWSLHAPLKAEKAEKAADWIFFFSLELPTEPSHLCSWTRVNRVRSITGTYTPWDPNDPVCEVTWAKESFRLFGWASPVITFVALPLYDFFFVLLSFFLSRSPQNQHPDVFSLPILVGS